jgi:hypothetical protein
MATSRSPAIGTRGGAYSTAMMAAELDTRHGEVPLVGHPDENAATQSRGPAVFEGARASRLALSRASDVNPRETGVGLCPTSNGSLVQ